MTNEDTKRVEELERRFEEAVRELVEKDEESGDGE
jgi:hypothetical protein